MVEASVRYGWAAQTMAVISVIYILLFLYIRIHALVWALEAVFFHFIEL